MSQISLIFVILGALCVISGTAEVPAICNDCSCEAPIVNCKMVCEVCSCEADSIDCESRKITQSFPTNASFWPTNSFKSLSLSHNLIGHVVPFPSLDIAALDLSFNKIVKIDAEAFIELTNLDFLDLSHNELTAESLSPEVFTGPYDATSYEPLKIKDLDLAFNELASLHQDVFEHLPNLERLNLGDNYFNGSLDRSTTVAICSTSQLQILNLRNNGLDTLPDTFLKNLVNLKELVLSGNRFTQLPVESLAYGTGLRILHLDDNPIKVFSTQQAFPSLPNLLQLHISFMPSLTRIEPLSLAKLTALTYLNCKDNIHLEHISEDALNAVNLTKLDLHDNALHYLSHKLVSHWERVDVDIRGNKWQCDCDNQWIVTTLLALPKVSSDGLICDGPEPMKGKQMIQLHERNYEMRCLDYYGNHPEKDATYLIATFVIVMVAMVVGAAIWWYRGGRCRKGRPIDYSAIYQKQVNDDFDSRYI